MEKTNSIIFSVDGRTDLLKEIVDFTGNGFTEPISLGEMNNRKFSDGELNVDFNKSIRGKKVYLLTTPINSDEILKLEFAIDAARRASAHEIIPILPYMPYSRQDKRDQNRGSIGAKVLAKKLEMLGATGIITMELHADQIEGFFDIPVTNIKGQYLFTEFIYNEHLRLGDVVLAATDAGGGKRVVKMQNRIRDKYGVSLPFVFAHKNRVEDNKVDEVIIIGDVKDKNVILLDDMCDTAGTLCANADKMIELGAKNVSAVTTHLILSGKAIDNIEKSSLSYVMGSNSLNVPKHEKLRTISVASEIGKAILANDYGISLSRIQNNK
jgi:ribose-phosphate pyrophosphokinase